MKLNIGSGKQRFPGFLNVDKSPVVNPDFLCNVDRGIDFDDDSVDEIKAKMILEHVDDIIFVMNELWRIMKHNSLLHIIVPHECSSMAWADPTHKRIFNEESFGYFCSKWHGGLDGKSNHYERHYEYGIKCDFHMVKYTETTDRRHGQIKTTLKAIKK
ncbi:unnamed protein product [marine sediment metagenome]|uniref:Methyltransferase type 11 domain-containing protein n=1 Tax=marine sediment metagenome TaxID=412755 RepID=X1A2X5_9ZZZZ